MSVSNSPPDTVSKLCRHPLHLLVHFFGPKLDKKLSVKAFKAFIAEMHDALVALEFEHYDCQHRGAISGTNFALALAAPTHIAWVDKYLDRVRQRRALYLLHVSSSGVPACVLLLLDVVR